MIHCYIYIHVYIYNSYNIQYSIFYIHKTECLTFWIHTCNIPPSSILLLHRRIIIKSGWTAHNNMYNEQLHIAFCRMDLGPWPTRAIISSIVKSSPYLQSIKMLRIKTHAERLGEREEGCSIFIFAVK